MHRRIKHAVDEHCSGRLVQFVFDRFAADRHFDNDVDVERWIRSGGNAVKTHVLDPLAVLSVVAQSRALFHPFAAFLAKITLAREGDILDEANVQDAAFGLACADFR
jgi:hypothetical protein